MEGGRMLDQQRRQVLEMLAEGTITVEQAERLIDALKREQPESSPRAGPRPKYLRVVMEDKSSADGGARMNVRVPLRLLRAGVRLTSLVPPQAVTRINAELARSGVPINLTEVKPQDIEEVIEQLDELTVELDDPDAKMQVFCE
jgi:hypothetical protein